MTAIVAVAIAFVIPAVLIGKGLKYKELPNYWHEPWPNEPELRAFLGNNIGLRADPRFRGSIFFYTFQFDEFLTLDLFGSTVFRRRTNTANLSRRRRSISSTNCSKETLPGT